MTVQKWYKRRYEGFLFKNRNDLYNLAVYVNNAKKRGLNNHEIKERLKKAKWDSEQIGYAMREYEGKGTGVFKIPVTNWSKQLKKDEQKNHGRGHESGYSMEKF